MSNIEKALEYGPEEDKKESMCNLTGFNGERFFHEPERPPHTEDYRETRHSDLLPIEGKLRGYELVALDDEDTDPYVLRDRWGRMLHVWPEGYTPTWMDIRDVVNAQA